MSTPTAQQAKRHQCELVRLILAPKLPCSQQLALGDAAVFLGDVAQLLKPKDTYRCSQKIVPFDRST